VTARLAGKRTLITGVGGGMGTVAARMFAEAGARVVGCDLHEEGARHTESTLRAAGLDVTVMGGVDLGDPTAAAAWVEAAARLLGGIDVLYNNASTQRFGSIEELATADWDFTMRNELDLVFYTCKAAWPHLKQSGSGVILNVGSIAALRGVEFMPQQAHAAAKAGVIALSNNLVVEGAAYGIRVNVISPGLIETPNTRAFLADPPERVQRIVLDRIPVGRVGRPEDIVAAAIFLASDEAGFINGANLVIDGGGSILG
jgi:meso-butanediol dehydrogenase/(S,S)-butanediol dehydrogenase/diacetyl reductase